MARFKCMALALVFTAHVFAYNSSTTTQACLSLEEEYPGLILRPNTSSYENINEDYFTAQEWLSPACIFTPTSSEITADAIKRLVEFNVPFAVKGGGCMPIEGAANINSSGILLSPVNLTGIELSTDQSSVSIRPGEDWASVYNFLEPYGLSVVGSRVGVVGVTGFLLGGGMSFFSNEFGWASANINAYEVVLSSGSIVEANATNEYSDLFWALRGGGNNFGIVTRVSLKTLPIPEVSIGSLSYGIGLRESFLSDLYNFSVDGVLDERAFVLPTISYVPAASANITYSAMLFYNSYDTNITTPPALSRFLPPIAAPSSNTFSARSLANWSAEYDASFDQIHGQNFRFYGFSILADLEAMYTAHDTFFQFAQERGGAIEGFISTLAMNPISASFIESNRGANSSGDPMGIDASSAPYFYCEQTLSWSSDSDTEAINQLVLDLNEEMQLQLGEALVPFIPLNNAGGEQEVFQAYDPTNLDRMVSIRNKYDPIKIYKNQLVGGFKVPDME